MKGTFVYKVSFQVVFYFLHHFYPPIGYQINAVLLQKSLTPCWKSALDDLKNECRNQQDKLITWVFFLFKFAIKFMNNFQKKNGWRLLNCEQADSNVTVVPCTSGDWSDIRGCLGKLQEKDAITYALMIGLVGPLCTYLERDMGPAAALWDLVAQVKKSFIFEDHQEISFTYIGKVVVSNIFPMYQNEFYSREFLVIFVWFVLSLIFGGTTSCHMAVLGLLLIEIIILLLRRSYLGFILELIFFGDHVLLLIFRYITLYVQYHGCGKCYWETIAYFIFFVPKSMLIAMDWLRSLNGAESVRDIRGRFTKK